MASPPLPRSSVDKRFPLRLWKVGLSYMTLTPHYCEHRTQGSRTLLPVGFANYSPLRLVTAYTVTWLSEAPR